MLCVPDGNPLVYPIACPVVALISTVPISVDPSKKLTIPVGVGKPTGALTVAVNATSCPAASGFADAVNVVVVVKLPPGRGLTVSFTADEVLVAKLLVPP